MCCAAVSKVPERGMHAATLLLLVLFGFTWGCATSSSFTYDRGALIRGDRTQKQIALVFTGGEHGESTATILDVLRELKLPAAFFVTGAYLANDAYHPHLQRMLTDGHYVGPHSDAHLLYCSWEDREQTLVTRDEFVVDLKRNIRALRTHGAMPPGQPIYFIPPYEWYNADQTRWSREMGVILFNFTPGSGSNRDWIPETNTRFVSSRQIRQDILVFEESEAAGLNGFILLLHLGSQRRDKMHTELEPLLRTLVERGYRFERVDRIAGH